MIIKFMNGSSTQKQIDGENKIDSSAKFYEWKVSKDVILHSLAIDGLMLEVFADGRKQKVIARTPDDILAMDSFNLFSNTNRAKFVNLLKNRFDGTQQTAIHRELIKFADDWKELPSEKKNESDANADKQFEIREDGVYALTGKSATFLCSPLEIVGATRNQDSEEWGRLLRFSDADNHSHTWAMPMSLLSGDGNEYRARLLNQGLILSPNKNAKELLTNYIQSYKGEKRIRCVSRVGWHGENYILPNETFSRSEEIEDILFQTENRIDHRFRSEGTLNEWQSQIACYCVGNSRLVFAASAAFAGVLLSPLTQDCAGFHYRGVSSIGKSSALYVAGSVFGGNSDKGFLNQWRSTINGLEAVSEMHNDGLLCLDEIGDGDKKIAGEAVYMLGNGQGKTRMSGKTMANRKTLTWKLIFMSTGELSLADYCAEAGIRTRAGQDVRLVDLEADAGCGNGLFENTHGFAHPSALADHLRAASLRFYGTAIREFLRFIVKENEITQKWNDFKNYFQKSFVPEGASGEVVRVAHKFALVAFAGEYAVNITLWQKGEAIKAAQSLFANWLANRTTGQSDIEKAVNQVISFIEQNPGRFQNVKNDESYIQNRVGFKRGTPDGNEWLFRPETFRTEVCRGHNSQAVINELKSRKLLIPRNENDNQQMATLPDLGRKSVYVIRLKDDGDGETETDI